MIPAAGSDKAIREGVRDMKKAIMILLAAMLLLASAALAENTVTDLSGEGYDCLYYQCTLPDGRVILTGWKGAPGNWQDSRARILCLNPDTTASWEYVDPAEGCCGYIKAAVLENGMIGVVFEDAPDQELAERKLKFFTAGGTPAGKEIDLTIPDGLIDGVTASCIWLRGYGSSRFFDWEGREIFRTANSRDLPGACDWMGETDDGLVFAGCTSEENAALILKLDFRGELMWKTALPARDLPGVEGANLTDCIRTEDGGYVAQLVEYGSEISAYRSLVRFSADGRLLWRNEDVFEHCQEMWLNGLAVHNGRIVAEMLGSGDEYGMNAMGTYLWLDGEGSLLGTTEYDMKDVELPGKPQGKGANTEISSCRLISTRDGLWSLGAVETESDSNGEALDSVDYFLVKLPEL